MVFEAANSARAGQGDFLKRGTAEPKKDQGVASGPPARREVHP
jgi:hypothetical protein